MRNSENNVFKTVKVNKEELLSVVRENLEKHIAQFEESKEDYLKALTCVSEQNVKIANKRLKQSLTGKIDGELSWKQLPPEPVSFEAEYNRAIRMLEMSVETDLDVEAQVFNQLALDEWSWKNQFLNVSTLVKGMI